MRGQFSRAVDTIVELTDEGLTARGYATFKGQNPDNLQGLSGRAGEGLARLAVRSWTSMEGEMTLEATHDEPSRSAARSYYAHRSSAR